MDIWIVFIICITICYVIGTIGDVLKEKYKKDEEKEFYSENTKDNK